MIVQVKNLGEAGSRGQFLVPGAVGTLRAEQVFDAFVHALAGRVATREQAQHRPGGLRGSAFGGCKYSVVVAGAALAPAAVRILNRPQPLAGAQDMDFPVVLAGGAQPTQSE